MHVVMSADGNTLTFPGSLPPRALGPIAPARLVADDLNDRLRRMGTAMRSGMTRKYDSEQGERALFDVLAHLSAVTLDLADTTLALTDLTLTLANERGEGDPPSPEWHWNAPTRRWECTRIDGWECSVLRPEGGDWCFEWICFAEHLDDQETDWPDGKARTAREAMRCATAAWLAMFPLALPAPVAVPPTVSP